MSKEIYISSTPHETRLAIVEKDELTEIYYERENEYTLAGSIYNGRVTRVLPGMQSSFVDIGLERDAFLYITDFMEEAGDSADFESTKDVARPKDGGNRDRGDRGRNRRDDRPRTPQAELAPTAVPAEEEPFEAAPRAANTDEIGEGAPGADGNRRWRGRRGRRRGRGGNGEPTTGDQSTEAPVENEAPEAANDDFIAAPVETQERTDRNDRGERRRGGRDQRDSRHNAIRERFAPRGLRNDSGEAETVDLDASSPSPEPFILPGESLSKYRRNEDGSAVESAPQTSVPANVIIPKPSTEVAPLLGWDGGAILPGETLSRHRDPEASNERSSSDRGDRGRDRRRDRDGRREDRTPSEPKQEFHQEFKPQVQLEPSEAVLPPISSGHDTEELEQPVQSMYQGPTEIVEEQEPVAEFHETTTDYEPEEDASASYRVDPVGPSEFRQSSVMEEFPVEEVHEQHAEPVSEPIIAEPSMEVEEQHVEHHEAEHHAEPEIEQPLQDSKTFAPGDGQLEEEILEDDDFEVGSIHASAFDDDTEEEIVDHPAELGRMLRDLSIDEITSSHVVDHGEEVDDFDIDEDDLEEDELDSSEEDHYEGDEISGSELSEAEEEEFAEAGSLETGETAKPVTERGPREGGRRGRRDNRRGGRDRERSSSSDRSSERSGERSSSSGSRDRRGMAGSRSGDRRGGRPSVQATDLPAISDLLKPGQEVLVQIAKEPIAKKGARITSHIALPGRFLVFMPTVNHVGVSRKI
jgi:ribonuclease G